MRHGGKIRIGISGWTYPPWRGVFYPKGLPHKQELAFAASQFRTIEINGTFYSLQRPESFATWAEQTPADFVFSVKAPRFLTHMKRLRDIEAPLGNFLGSGLLRLGEKLGPILWQFPANFRFEPERLEAFFHLLPRDTARAAAFAKRHADHRLAGRAWTRTDADPSAAPRLRDPPRELSRPRLHRPACADTTWRWSAPTPWTGRA